MENDRFVLINRDEWARNDEFNFFSKGGCNFNTTANIDITKLYQYAKNNNLKVYSVLVSVTIKIINKHQEFKFGYQNEKLGYYEVVHPIFYQLMDNHNTKMLWAEYSEDIDVMVSRIEQAKTKWASKQIYKPQETPPNTVMISCLPWFTTTSVSFELQYGFHFLAPIIIYGCFKKENDKIIIPLSIYVNHLVADGYHVCSLLQDLQNYIDTNM